MKPKKEQTKTVVTLYNLFSDFLHEKKVKNRFFIELIFNDILYKHKHHKQNVFFIDTKKISSKFNISIKAVREGLNYLIRESFLIRVKESISYRVKYTYKIDFNFFLKSMKVSNLDEFYKSKANFIPLELFSTITTKRGTADLKSIFLFCYIFLKALLSENNSYKMALKQTMDFLSRSKDTCLRAFKKLTDNALIYRLALSKDIECIERGVTTIILKNRVIDIDEVRSKKVERSSKLHRLQHNIENSTIFKNVDNSVDNSVDNFFTKEPNLLPIRSQIGSRIYKKEEKKIDKGISFFEKEGKKKVLRGGCFRAPPPPQKVEKKIISNKEVGKLGEKSMFLEENKWCYIESTLKEFHSAKNGCKAENEISDKKTFEELIPSHFTVEYENFIFNLERKINYRLNTESVKNLVKKLSKKYSEYKFKNLDAVSKYFVIALQNERVKEKKVKKYY